MGNKHKEKQHYVPKFLLKNFSQNGKTIIALDRVSNSIIYRSVDSICAENDLYEEKWENANPQLGKYVLDNKIENSFVNNEGKMSTLTKQIENDIMTGKGNVLLSTDERETLFDFVTYLYLRNPAKMKEIISDYDSTDKAPEVKKMRDNTDYIFNQWGWGSSKSLFDHSKKFMIFSSELEGSPYNVERARLSKMRYVFWHSTEEEFVLSSFPLQFVIDDNEMVHRILLPISSRIAIVFFNQLLYGMDEGSVMAPYIKDIRANMKMNLRILRKDVARFFIAKNEDTLKRLMR
ncbi:MAG: DUF4238 domain-containing protein [Lachnospiraceae bacterium]|nr:DUF4238 domain-containing protein [Lachnospiraceae bacterium]